MLERGKISTIYLGYIYTHANTPTHPYTSPYPRKMLAKLQQVIIARKYGIFRGYV